MELSPITEPVLVSRTAPVLANAGTRRPVSEHSHMEASPTLAHGREVVFACSAALLCVYV